MLAENELARVIEEKIVAGVALTLSEAAESVCALDKNQLRKMVLLKPLRAGEDKRTFLESDTPRKAGGLVSRAASKAVVKVV